MPAVMGMFGESFEFWEEFGIVIIRNDRTPMESYLKFFSPARIPVSSTFSCGGRAQAKFGLYAQEGLYARLKSKTIL